MKSPQITRINTDLKKRSPRITRMKTLSLYSFVGGGQIDPPFPSNINLISQSFLRGNQFDDPFGFSTDVNLTSVQFTGRHQFDDTLKYSVTNLVTTNINQQKQEAL
jgi:hypothetical protein